EALDQRVGGVDQPERDVRSGRALQVDGQRPPAAMEHGERADGPRLGRPVDADDLRAEVGEDHSAERAGPDPAELDHTDAGERAGRARRACPAVVSAGSRAAARTRRTATAWSTPSARRRSVAIARICPTTCATMSS